MGRVLNGKTKHKPTLINIDAYFIFDARAYLRRLETISITSPENISHVAIVTRAGSD